MIASPVEADGGSTHAAYDKVPYPGNAIPHTHPSHLAAVARVCGLTPPAPQKCRVLGLGCSIGSNIIPMAESLPESEFIGIDSSAHQIETGNATLEQLDVNNLELRHLDIADIDESFGKFDYIICHGVYSWVPKKIQDAILDLCRSRLNENGVAYISYNTNPGWHLRGAIRDMMCYHARNFETPQEQINQARQLLKFLAASAKTRFEAYPKMLQQEAESLSKRSDSYIYHEFLAAVNEPIYFHEFVDRVHSAGMKYVADADVRTMLSRAFDEEAAGLLRDVPLLRREQYMDFLRSRMFRASLLCQSEAGPRAAGSASCLLPLHVDPDVPDAGEKGR